MKILSSMNRIQISCIFFLLLLSCKSQGQSALPNYDVDEKIKDLVDSNIENMNGVPVGRVEMKFYEDDILVFDNFGKEEEKGELAFMTTEWKQDNVCIIGIFQEGRKVNTELN